MGGRAETRDDGCRTGEVKGGGKKGLGQKFGNHESLGKEKEKKGRGERNKIGRRIKGSGAEGGRERLTPRGGGVGRGRIG